MDLIDRQQAIDALMERFKRVPTTAIIAKDIIENLPSAQPERKKGEWIIEDDHRSKWYRVTCSECGENVTSTVPMIGFFPNAKVLWDFCPNCGANMRGEENE